MIIELVPHVDAGDRALWHGEQDERPLSELGRRQAEALARALTASPVDGLYSSPALRCLETVGPVSELSGGAVAVVPALAEARPREGRDELGERGLAALEEIAGTGEGRAVVCSHGDIIPAIVDRLVERHGLALRSRLGQRGEWYTVTLAGGQAGVVLNRAPDGFPR